MTDLQVRGAANPPQYQTMPVTQPAIMQPTQEAPPPAYTKTGQQQAQPIQQQQFTTAEFQVQTPPDIINKVIMLKRRKESDTYLAIFRGHC